jgi:uncharacterized protein (DUF2147 family)
MLSGTSNEGNVMTTRLVLLILALAAGAALAGDDPSAIVGVWETEPSEPGEPYSHVEVVEMDGRFFGSIVWLSEPLYADDDPEAGKPLRDRENPDTGLQDRPILGLPLMRDFKFHKKDGKWVDGRIYDPESGKEYDCKLTLKDSDTLEVFGYVKVGFVKLGRDSVWKRVPAAGG